MKCANCYHPEDEHTRLSGCVHADEGPTFCTCRTYVAPPVATPPPASTGVTIPARNTDPATSKAATPPPIKAGTQRAKMLAGFAALGDEGGMDETAAEAAGVSLGSEYAKRSSELRQAKLISLTGAVRTGASGQERIVSRITDDGRAVLDQLGAPIPAKPEKRRQITLTVPEAEALRRLSSQGSRGMSRSLRPGDTEVMVRPDDLVTVCAALTARDDRPARRG